MLSETDIYWLASMRGWRITVAFLHEDNSIRGVFLLEGQERHLWGPLGAVQRLTLDEFLACLECLNSSVPEARWQCLETICIPIEQVDLCIGVEVVSIPPF